MFTEPLPSIALAILQIIFVFCFSPLLIGIMRKVKARLQGRTGSPIYQPYLDLLKLFSKGTVKSDVTSFIFVIAPILGFVSVAVAALLLPILLPLPVLAGSIITFAYLFAIGRFLTALSGLDAGSAFGGLGSSREMLYSVLIEPALFAIIIFLAAYGGGMTITALATDSASWQVLALSPSYWLAVLALFVVILAETGRLPFDNPATHLELTMVHEAMILENSGPNLALIEWANSAKIFLMFSLLIILFSPPVFQDNLLLRGAFIAIVAVILSILTAVVESISVKVRLFKVAELLVLSMLFAILAVLTKIFRITPGNEILTTTLMLLMLLSSLYFIFSATFKRRLEIYIFQSLCLVLIFVQPVLTEGTPDAYFRLVTTIIFKILIVPIVLYELFSIMPGEVKLLPMRFYNVFRTMKKELRLNLDFDPLFVAGAMTPVRTLIYSGVLIILAFILSAVFGVGTSMLPLVLSMILVGMLIIAVKTHLLLQLMGFLLMENGVVLLPTALSLKSQFIGEAVTLFDIVVLVIVAILLALKIQKTLGSFDTGKLDELIEKR